MKRQTVKTIVITITVLALIVGATVIIFKYKILQYSAEELVRRYLPDYITVEKMSFDFKSSRIVFSGFRILNPPEFSRKYLLEIGEIECRYRMKGMSILSGVEILSPVFRQPLLSIDRLPDGRTNLQEASEYMQELDRSARSREAARPQMVMDTNKAWQGAGAAAISKAMGKNGLSDMVKLPEEFIVKGGRVIFLDGMVKPGAYTITLDEIEATLRLKLDNTYTRAINVSTVGIGVVNGKKGETVRWDTKLDPATPELTMSNNFNVSNVNITAFAPYYDKYSPFNIKSGYFSGSLIFDFDNGNIGSTNEVMLSKLSFNVKNGYENAQYLEANVPDLVKYFTSANGDVIFDFKIKGPMSDPKFYLGPVTKQAIGSMVIDKIAQALSDETKAQANPQSAADNTGKMSDMDKAAEYIKMIKGILKEK